MGEAHIVPDPPGYDKKLVLAKLTNHHKANPLPPYSRPFPSVELLSNNKLPNCPGKSSVCLMVTFAPNGSTPPHTHAGASVSVVVLEGAVLNKMNDSPTHVIEAGGSFFEAPGCHHRVSDNYSTTEPAKLLASLVVDTDIVETGGVQALVVVDEEYRS